MLINTVTPGDDGASEDLVDVREQLYNGQLIGPVGEVQLPLESITQLHAVLFDLDPKNIHPDNPLFPHAEDPRRFFARIEPILARHPLARQAEVRMTGTGLHVLPRFRPAIELRSAADQKRFAAIVRVVQCSLPADPNAPGITGLTRAVGSINSKNGARVEVLSPGVPVDASELESFAQQLVAAPFETIATILAGSQRIEPCPICRRTGTRLEVLDHVGRCYPGCGRVTVAMLYDSIYTRSDA